MRGPSSPWLARPHASGQSLPYPIHCHLRHMQPRGRKTHASRNRRFFFPLRVVSGETCDSPCQIINISFQAIPHLMLTMCISGCFDIFYMDFRLLQHGDSQRMNDPVNGMFFLNLYVRLGWLFHMPRWDHFQEQALLLVLQLAEWHYTNIEVRKVPKHSAFIVMECDANSPPSLPIIPSYIGGLHHWKQGIAASCAQGLIVASQKPQEKP